MTNNLPPNVSMNDLNQPENVELRKFMVWVNGKRHHSINASSMAEASEFILERMYKTKIREITK